MTRKYDWDIRPDAGGWGWCIWYRVRRAPYAVVVAEGSGHACPEAAHNDMCRYAASASIAIVPRSL